MNTRRMLTIGAAVLMTLGATAIEAHALHGTVIASDPGNARKAASDAKATRKALRDRKADAAILHAESAVANDPQNGAHRALLGQAYLMAGRFTSAAQALEDASALDPQNGQVALNLALARVANGDGAGARALLARHAATIPPSDLGLAHALAGDPVAAIDILAPLVRDAGATAKTRQNLALALALAGRWGEAKAVAAMDIAPDQLNDRLIQWARFAQPANAYDQVAALLGVIAVEDGGQPVKLALVRQPSPAPAVAEAAPMPEPLPEPEPAPAIAAALPEPVFAAPPMRVPAPKPAKVATARPAASGPYVVQLGAFANAAVARDAWRKLGTRVSALARLTPQGASVARDGATFYRLSVGGFARNDAHALCRTVTAAGGACFVRLAAGDAVAGWYTPRTRVATR
jgi:Flp pilus assembly protein TadD